MPNLMERAQTVSSTWSQAAAGYELTYSRAGQAVTLTGWPGQKYEYEVIDDSGVITLAVSDSWRFNRSELVFADDSDQFAVRPGDQITQSLNGEDTTYEVMPPGKGPLSKRIGAAEMQIEIYVKVVSRRPTP